MHRQTGDPLGSDILPEMITYDPRDPNKSDHAMNGKRGTFDTTPVPNHSEDDDESIQPVASESV